MAKQLQDSLLGAGFTKSRQVIRYEAKEVVHEMIDRAQDRARQGNYHSAESMLIKAKKYAKQHHIDMQSDTFTIN